MVAADPKAPGDAIGPRVARDQLTQLLRLTPQPVVAGALFSLLVGWVLWPQFGGPLLAGWVAARVLISAARVWDCRDFLAAEQPDAALAPRRRRFLVLMAGESASWSAMGLLFAGQASPQTGLVLLTGLVAVSSVSVFSLATDFRASGLFVGIVLLPNALQQLALGTPESLIIGSGLLILLALLGLEALGLHRRMAELLRLRHENAAIAEQRQRALLLAEHSSRAKSRFLATVSHEMRTPLNGILGMTQLLQQTSADAAQRKQLDVVAQSARHLQAVIGDLLDLSRIEAGRVLIEHAPVELRTLVREVVDLLAPVARQKGLRFEHQEAADLPDWIEADGPRIKQVLHNLLGNAIKFTPAGTVTLDLARDAGQPQAPLLFSVRDTGIGIAADELERIFGAFEQVAAPGTPEFRSGTGLGLTISRELAQAMGGNVDCSSEPGRGTVFRFALPCVPCAPAAQGAEAAPVPTALAGRVLVAEDSPVNAMIAKEMLERMGIEVDIATDGLAAIERMHATDYSAVLMDCQMPELDGWEATRRWREHERGAGGRHMPIIALTANAVLGDRERCLAAGMDDYLPKPFELSALAALMRRHLAA